MTSQKTLKKPDIISFIAPIGFNTPELAPFGMVVPNWRLKNTPQLAEVGIFINPTIFINYSSASLLSPLYSLSITKKFNKTY